MSEAEKSYHLERAQAEMDLAARAAASVVAEAHRKLSLLHMDRLKELDEACDGAAARSARPGPILEAW